MKPVHKLSPFLLIVFVVALVLTACGGASQPENTAAPQAAQPQGNAAQDYAAGNQAAAVDVAQEQAGADSAAKAESGDETANIDLTAAQANDPSRKVIKDATLTLEVKDITLALSQIDTIAVQTGGYVIETNTQFVSSEQQSAYGQMAVPAEQFEAVIQRLRDIATSVLNEQISGSDVSQEFVDLQSQLVNLEATQARIRGFLDQAKNVEEALQVNARLSEIEGQINQIKGRLQYLSQRTSFSTITVRFELPSGSVEAQNAPAWQASAVAQQAYAALQAIVQSVATVAIWLAVVGIPVLIPLVLLVFVLRFLFIRLRSVNKPVGKATMKG